MKILGGDLEPSAGQVVLDPNERLGKLRQDQFAYEDERVLDVVMMGHEEMWAAMHERDAIYANPDASEEDYMRAADLEARFAEFGGYTAEARAGELLLGVGIPTSQHQGPMREIAPGWKLRLLLDEPTNNLDINTIRWLEGVLNERDSTMVIISHDRHFLNAVCTHMADLDYGELRVYPGSYDEYMFAAAEARARIAAANARSKERIAELQEFVQRFAANKAKARQATSRQKMIAKIKSEAVEVKPSSRQNPYIRFEVARPLHRVALEVEHLGHRYPDAPAPVFQDVSLIVQAGEKIAIVGDSGAGKTTLLRALIGPERGGLAPSIGSAKWAENADVGVMAQDVHPDFESDANLTDWIGRYTHAGDDEQVVRGVLGRLLFSGDEVRKPVKVLSGGEMHRMSFGRLMLGRHNVLLMDEPTNHLDMESIESLQLALEKFSGTLFVVSHDRQFVNAVANRVWIVKDGRVFDWQGTYDEYLASQGLA
jgi:ATPase subunit of ABC transporter with duplicated ATPase domains